MANNYQIVEKFQQHFYFKISYQKADDFLSETHKFFFHKMNFFRTGITIIYLFTVLFISGFL
jgi:hypothetical protein